MKFAILSTVICLSFCSLSCAKSSGNIGKSEDNRPIVHTPDAVICPMESYGRTTKYFFFDLKGNPSAFVKDEQLAATLFGKDGMNGVRIPIYGDAKNGGHTAEGKVDEHTYDKVLASIDCAKRYKGDGEFHIMASKKLEGKTSFPEWVKDGSNGVNPKKYAAMLMDYLRFMKEKGIIIDVLGIDNEINFNEGNITPAKFAEIVDIVKSQTALEGIKVPLIIGPERYCPQLDFDKSWMKGLVDGGFEDRMDIFGTHYYPKHHTPQYFEALKAEFLLAQSDRKREFWATEPHWDNNDEAKADMLYHSEAALCAMFDYTDLGMDAFMWWGYNNDNSLRTALMRAYSLAVYGSCPIRMSDSDGEETMTRGKLQTRAYRRDNEINVFIINMSPDSNSGKAYSNYRFAVKDASISGKIAGIRWSDSTDAAGMTFDMAPDNDGDFSIYIPVRSITKLTFQVK